MKHKKLRTVLITVVVIAALVAAYMIAFMRPQPLLDCLGGTEAPTTGTLTVYDQAHQEGQKWDVAEGSELDEVWQAMQSAQVRFLRGHGVVTLRQALVKSMNQATVNLLDRVGIDAARLYAGRFGIELSDEDVSAMFTPSSAAAEGFRK